MSWAQTPSFGVLGRRHFSSSFFAHSTRVFSKPALFQKPKLFLNRFRMLAQQLLGFISNGMRSTSSTMALPPVMACPGHPRNAETFSRALAQYVREKKTITLMDALRKSNRNYAPNGP
jgi:hypothetical protein